MKEHAVLFGDESPLAGVVTEPDGGGDRHAPVFLFLNAGLTHRVGPNRLYVTLARKLAEAGVTSLRFDLSGIGDSPVSRSVAATEERGVREAVQAMDFVERSLGVHSFVPIGLCSGASVGYTLVLSDPRVAGAVLINAYNIPSTHTKEQSAEAWTRAQTHHHGSRIADWKGWTRVLTRRSDLRAVLRSTFRLTRRALRLEGSPPTEADLGLLPDLERRGVELLAIYSEGDLGLELLVAHVPNLKNLDSLSRFQLEIIRETDHILTPLWAQQRIETLVLEWAGRRLSLNRAGTERTRAATS
jgi:hypothetical protein